MSSYRPNSCTLQQITRINYIVCSTREVIATASTQNETVTCRRMSVFSSVAAVETTRCLASTAIGQSAGAPAQVLEGMTIEQARSRRDARDTVSIAEYCC